MDPAPYSDNWHLHAIAEHLEAVTFGQIPRLIISIPPRCSKSLMVSVSWLAWMWAQEADERYPLKGPQVSLLSASYAQTLSERDSLKTHRLIESRWYQERWGKNFSFMADKDTVRKFENNRGGYRLATSVGGSLTGEGADILCVLAGETVHTPRGAVPIEHVRAGDTVFAFDHLREMVQIGVVTKTASKKRNGRVTTHTTEGFSVRVSFEHTIFVQGKGYVQAGRIQLGDRLVCSRGAEVHDQSAMRGLSQDAPPWETGTVAAIEFDREAEYLAYDLSVAKYRNFFAGGILVHNSVDDSINAKEANYATIREAANRWWDESMSTRLNNQVWGAKVLTMQRLHEDDMVGHILERAKDEDWDRLIIPMEYDGDWRGPTSIGWADPRSEEGELLWEERFPRDVVDRLKRELGPYASSAQLQQAPSPRAGGIIERQWWQLWPAPGYEPPLGEKPQYPMTSLRVGSIDTAYGEKDENAWNAMTAWGLWTDSRERPKVVMMEAWRARLPLRGVIPAECKTEEERKPHWGLAEKIADTIRRRQLDIVLIEDKTRGKDLSAEIRRLLTAGECQIVMINPKGDKVARLHACQAMFADRMVYAPDTTWADMVITEVSQFPKSKWLDLTDTCSQFLQWARASGILQLGTEADTDNVRRNTFVPKKAPLYDV